MAITSDDERADLDQLMTRENGAIASSSPRSNFWLSTALLALPTSLSSPHTSRPLHGLDHARRSELTIFGLRGSRPVSLHECECKQHRSQPRRSFVPLLARLSRASGADEGVRRSAQRGYHQWSEPLGDLVIEIEDFGRRRWVLGREVRSDPRLAPA
jgi:hypothetical protein